MSNYKNIIIALLSLVIFAGCLVGSYYYGKQKQSVIDTILWANAQAQLGK